MIVFDDFRVINKLEASLVDDARVIIYNRHMFIVQATGKAGLYWQPSFFPNLSMKQSNGTEHFINVKNYLNTNIFSYLKTSDGQKI